MTTKRDELPHWGITTDPDGRRHILKDGVGFGPGRFEPKQDGASGEDFVIRIPVEYCTEVPWATLEATSREEHAHLHPKRTP